MLLGPSGNVLVFQLVPTPFFSLLNLRKNSDYSVNSFSIQLQLEQPLFFLPCEGPLLRSLGNKLMQKSKLCIITNDKASMSAKTNHPKQQNKEQSICSTWRLMKQHNYICVLPCTVYLKCSLWLSDYMFMCSPSDLSVGTQDWFSSVMVCLVILLLVCARSGGKAVTAWRTRSGAQTDLPLGEVEEVSDKVVEDVLVLHALVEHLQGLEAWGVFANGPRQVA